MMGNARFSDRKEQVPMKSDPRLPKTAFLLTAVLAAAIFLAAAPGAGAFALTESPLAGFPGPWDFPDVRPLGNNGATPSNAGFAGLWEYPAAEIAGDGLGWIGWSEVDPFACPYVTLGYLPRLEFNLRLTNFLDGPVVSPGYGHYKDKGMDVKYLLFPEEGTFPAVAVGALDLAGTRLLKANYVVLTRHRWPFTLSAGWGTDRLNGFFGGVSWILTPYILFKAEYGNLDYSRDRNVTVDTPEQRWNAGFVVETPWGTDLSLSWQRGSEWGLGLSQRFDLRRPFFGGRKPRFARAEKTLTDVWEGADLNALADGLREVLSEKLGLRGIRVLASPYRVLAAFEAPANGTPEACARIAVLAADLLPRGTESMSIVPLLRGTPAVRLEIPGSALEGLRQGRIDPDLPRAATASWVDRKSLLGEREGENWSTDPDAALPWNRVVLRLQPAWEPRVDRTLDDVFMSRLSLDAIAGWTGSRGWAAMADVRIPLANDIEIWWEPETNDETRIWKAVVSQVVNLGDGTFLVGEAGWLDENWFGGNAWARRYFGGGRWFAGGRLSMVHERDPQSFAGLSDAPVTRTPYPGFIVGNEYEGNGWWWGLWGQLGFHEPRYDLDLMASVGQFLDEDRGVRLSVDRRFGDSRVGFWIARTDVLTEGKDYSNAGVSLELPVGAWWGTTDDASWSQEFSLLSTWEYYTARQPGTWMPPDRLLGPLNPDRLPKAVVEALLEGMR
jgi:hypothetical protein